MELAIGQRYICDDERVKYIKILYNYPDCTSEYNFVGLVITDIGTSHLEFFSEVDGRSREDSDYNITGEYNGRS